MFATLFLLLGLLIGYRVGEYKIHTQKKSLIRQAGQIVQLEAKIDRYEQYVPKTEIHKWEIIRLHDRGWKSREIGNKLNIDQSAVCRALRRWKISTYLSV